MYNSDALHEFLNKHKLEAYYNILLNHCVSYKDLGLLTKQDLMDMQIPIGPRNRLLAAINPIDKMTNVSSNSSVHLQDSLSAMILQLAQRQE